MARKTAIAFDTETTDLLPPEAADIIYQPFIIEFYACKFDIETGEILGEVNSLVGCPIKLPDHIVKITGINDEMIKNKPHFDFVIPKFVELCKGERIIVGHNVMFDYEVVRRNFIRYGMEDQFPHFEIKECTIELSYPIKRRRMKLSELYHTATGKTHEGAHRAKADVLATVESYRWLLKEGF